jgi:uncharacterized membrane protein YjjB (DUF3815 family)
LASDVTQRQAVAPVSAENEPCLALLRLAARMLLEYNVRSSILKGRIDQLAAHLGINSQTVVAYRTVAIQLADGRVWLLQTPEYRLNVAVASAALRLIELVCTDRVDPPQALEQMQSLQHAGPCHKTWALALIWGAAASALACILHADLGAVIVTGLASALGLLARRALAGHHWPLFSLPFVAAAVGGAIGGLAIRLGLTQTPGLCLMVPGLMLVPGPHLINGLYDLYENHIQTGLCRLVLAAGILLSAAAGVCVGAWLVMGLRNITPATSDAVQLTLLLDMALAGIAACGFGAFYNSPWRVLWISVVCGMAGHGIRFLCLAEGWHLPVSTLMACLVIGLFASVAVRRRHLPFSSVAFAGAVPMMPGALIYRAIAGAVQLSRAGTSAEPALATATLAFLLQATLVVAAMAAGLLVGALVTSSADYYLQSAKRHT